MLRCIEDYQKYTKKKDHSTQAILIPKYTEMKDDSGKKIRIPRGLKALFSGMVKSFLTFKDAANLSKALVKTQKISDLVKAKKATVGSDNQGGGAQR